MFKKANPGCPCCEPGICLIQFNALDSDLDLTGNFTLADAENFAYHGDPFFAIQVSEAGQLATASTAHPQSPYPPRVMVDFYGDQIGSQARIVLGGMIVAQVTLGDDCSELDLLLESDDSELTPTLIMPYIDRNEWHRLSVCFDPDTGVVKATVTDLTESRTFNLDAVYTGTALTAYAAFGTGPTSADNVYFRDFYFWRLWYCGDSPYTSDCHILGDDWDYYYELPVRSYCFACTPSCTLVDAGFSTYPDGDMPCDWDASAWTVASGLATGAGAVTHTATLTGTGYIVTATFTIGTLATDGDAVTVGIVGSSTFSATVTRNSSTSYTITYSPAGFAAVNSTTQPTTVILSACPATIQTGAIGAGGQVVVASIITDPMGVTITQPTMADHVDSSLASFVITKHDISQAGCPQCDAKCDEDCDFPDVIAVDLGEPFMTAQYGCEACEAFSGIVGAESGGNCAWGYNNAPGCPCDNDTDCSPTATGVWNVLIQYAAGVWYGTIYPNPVLGDCNCVANAGAQSYEGVGDCDDSPVTLTATSGPGWIGGVAGAECTGTYPATIRVALQVGDL